ncbi:MAG: 2Fe-2S iron-sulfur cluster-binding protein, partial [Candidatus Limnocylindrales bacterium]
MSEVYTLTIDGKDVAGNEGQTVMEVAEENSIDIPGLCHLEGITDRGACRLCMVEIAGSPKLAAACMTKIAEGMDITAHSDKLLEYRQSITEMMFMERNHVCAVCVANNHCELQNMADELG